ncbi:hypothetical protein BDN67DRAFT_322182 [Paxillus ammoniavirescens]|nr:hypothetical protein BDN67DRAFT_322182 [Paxillus ammoniavirescens]
MQAWWCGMRLQMPLHNEQMFDSRSLWNAIQCFIPAMTCLWLTSRSAQGDSPHSQLYRLSLTGYLC